MSRTGEMHPDPFSKGTTSRDRLRRWAIRIAVLALLFAGLVGAFHVLAPEPEKELAAFDAARAVPDEDNAALIYAELTQGEEVPPDELAIKLDLLFAIVEDPVSLHESRASQRKLRELEWPQELDDPNANRVAASYPWRSADYPELTRWLARQETRIDRLLEAAHKPACYFPLQSAPGRMGLFDVPLGALRQNVFLLSTAANNDLGEGDVDGALAKWQALMAIGQHLRAQPSQDYLLSGISFEAVALHRFAKFAVEGPATDRHLQELALQCKGPDREWESIRHDINHVRSIFSRLLDDQRSLKVRMHMRYRRILYRDKEWDDSYACELYHRLQSERRGLRILIELRRFKDRTGRWPASLDEIAPSLPPETLVDPASDGPYVYRLSEQGFTLYSVGPNRIDENGRHKSNGPDDWPIWPPRGRMAKAEQKDVNEP